ncbi:hypothetical protein AA0313_0102 [Acetobacter indonesiensis NRIC 0313]|nr:hypothetical protein AA0313_0102 [Acetobacter indonesiensis NRIC 0313]
MYTLPSTEDRLKNGIRLSDCYHAFALLDDWIEANFDGMSRAMCECMLSGIPEQAFDFPDKVRGFLGPTDLVPKALREFERYRYAIYENIKSLLKSGRLTAYGKEKITDEKWQTIPCQYFSLECKISFDENKVTVEGVSFLDVRITCLESLPIWCAVVAYGDQELVPSLMRRVGACRVKMASKGSIHALFDEIRIFRRYFCSLMQKEELKGYYLGTDEQVSPTLWNEHKIGLARSEICIAPKKWRHVKIYTPHPPLNETDTNTLATATKRTTANVSRVPSLPLPKTQRGNLEEDGRLIEEMFNLIRAGKAKNAWQATDLVVDKAAGHGTIKSKKQRLHARFQKAYKENSE